ncbi:Beta-galactosidase [Geodia barretti]|uniref:Beta-galactosidase n=1 Tax=Geodia barretti TaxID=519541 RepID=A0AA35T9P5_GEOBA|nr:Beta-galactosidase [Geodia barretti]
MHYARVPSAYWRDRLQKMKDCGLNTVQTYVPWNFHEPRPGVFDFSGDRNLSYFLQTAQDVGLLVIVRAGPYICAEWDMGGLPAWLLTHKDIALRSSDTVYLDYVDKWMTQLLPIVKSHLYSNNGPVITVQVENEYGSYYACDKKYMEHLYVLFRYLLGDDVVLFTTDGDSDGYLKCGTLTPYLYATVDFGVTVDPAANFKSQRDYEPKGPLVNSEFYTGWLDHWGQPHQTKSSKAVADSLYLILKLNASVNMYMFEGWDQLCVLELVQMLGSTYQPQPTSYDYNAPLTEAGDPWEKYTLVSQVISSYTGTVPYTPLVEPKGAYGKVYMTAAVGLFDSPQLVANQVSSDTPVSMEMLGQSFGFMIYSTKLPSELTGRSSSSMTISGLKDRASVYIDGVLKGTGMRGDPVKSDVSLTIDIPSGAVDLDIVVENMGRINYGSLLNDSKGILGSVGIDGQALTQWVSKAVPLDNSTLIPFQQLNETVRMPNSTVFYRGTFRFDGQAYSTYLNVSGWSKGVAFVNGYSLGRYWPVKGPQKTLYVPGAFLRSNTELNELILFEIDHSPCIPPYNNCFVSLVDTPDIG